MSEKDYKKKHDERVPITIEEIMWALQEKRLADDDYRAQFGFEPPGESPEKIAESHKRLGKIKLYSDKDE